jgi:hypothetical protein
MIPTFDDNNNLPPGVYEVIWQEFCDRYGYTKHRRELLDGLKIGLTHLKNMGCRCVWIDGSFISAKNRPGDFDVCWNINEVNIPYLELMYPALLDFENGRARQKQKYGGEFFPSSWNAVKNPPITYLDFFQKDRNDNPKGIIKIVL